MISLAMFRPCHMHSSSLIYTKFYLHLQLIYLCMHATRKMLECLREFAWTCAFYAPTQKINKRLVRHTHMRPHHPIQIDRCNVIDKRSNRNGFFMLHSASLSLSLSAPSCACAFDSICYLSVCFALPVCLFVCQSVSVWLMFLFLAISPGCLLCIVVVTLDTWIRLCLCKN